MLETIITKSSIRLKLLRALFSLNKKQFSKLLETPYNTFRSWEKTDIRISLKATKILIKLGINPQYINGDNEPILNGFTLEQVKQNILNKMIEDGIQ